MDFIGLIILIFIISYFIFKNQNAQRIIDLEKKHKIEIASLTNKVNKIEKEAKAEILKKDIVINDLNNFITANTNHPPIIENIVDEKIEIKNPEVFKRISALIDNGQNLFITGGAGTGKSFILNLIRQKYNIAVTSTTGISAINVNGQTIHSWSGVGICTDPIPKVINSLLHNPVLRTQINNCRILAIDEISMLSAKTMDYINDVLKGVRKSSLPFGGIQVLIFGDFFQLPPVIKEKNEKKIFAFESQAWQELNLTPIILNKVFRQDELSFVKALNNARVGNITDEDMKVFNSCEISFDSMNSPIIHIFSTNKEADGYNDFRFSKIKQPVYEFPALDKVHHHNKDGSITETLVRGETMFQNKSDLSAVEKLDKDCKAPRILQLKIGCRVMLLKNISFDRNLINGSIGTIEELDKDSITVLFDNGERYPMSTHCFEYYSGGVLKATREQYPLRLAYGITIHKSQGTTLDNAIIDFNKTFAYGQSYVALSRTRTLKGLHLKSFSANKVLTDDKVIDFYNKIEEKQQEKII